MCLKKDFDLCFMSEHNFQTNMNLLLNEWKIIKIFIKRVKNMNAFLTHLLKSAIADKNVAQSA